MLKLLKNHFGYDSFRPLQREIIDTVLAGQDALVLMPTGGGKSLCFQLPALVLPGITLVVSPLIALMKDQVDALCANGISAAFINSSLTAKQQRDVMERAGSGDLKILYLAPERLSSSGFSDFLDTLNISLLAIDEAHCISEWGHDFRPEYRNLHTLREKFSNAPVIALTATATPRVQEDIIDQLKITDTPPFVSSFNRENLHYTVRSKFNAFSQLTELLQSQKEKSAIIYCFSRKDTERTAIELSHAGLKALPYHAGLSKDLRIQTQEKFIRDEAPIIVATIAFGMGIDKPDVRLVVHMDIPKTVEGYYQETGRAGRDGLPSECILFYSYADRRKQEYFINHISNPNEKKLAINKLDNIVDYCQSDACRRTYLLDYFGENRSEPTCDACDNCVTPDVEHSDATEISKKILSAVLRTGERFGVAHICDVLRGSNKKRILELGHNKLSVHGIAQSVPMTTLREYLQALKKLGFLEQNTGDYPTLRVSSKGKQALQSDNPILLPVSNAQKTKSVRASESKLEYDVEAFDKLRAIRKEIADEQDVPPFIIFGDRTLHEMAYYFPSTLDALSNIFGVGTRKLESFGEEFLKCIAAHVSENQLEEKPIPTRASPRTSNKPSRSSATLDETKSLFDQKLTVEEMAQQRGLTQGTIIQHIEKLLYTNKISNIDHIKPAEPQFKEIQKAFKATKFATLTSIHKHLKEKYTYDELRLVRLFL